MAHYSTWTTIDWVVVLRPTQNKLGHFGDVPKPISWLGIEKLNLTQKNTFTNQKKCTTTQNKHKKLNPGLVASYDIQLWGPIPIMALYKFVAY